MFAQLAVDASDRDRIGESWNDVTSPNLRFTRLCRKNSQKNRVFNQMKKFLRILLSAI